MIKNRKYYRVGRKEYIGMANTLSIHPCTLSVGVLPPMVGHTDVFFSIVSLVIGFPSVFSSLVTFIKDNFYIQVKYMNEYMLIYKGGDPESQKNTSAEDMAAALQRWGAWMGKLEAQDKLVSGGSPLHYSGKRIDKNMVVTDIAASEFKELVSGYSIIKAGSIEEAADLAKSCPIFEYPDIVVEVREVMQLG